MRIARLDASDNKYSVWTSDIKKDWKESIILSAYPGAYKRLSIKDVKGGLFLAFLNGKLIFIQEKL